MTDSETTLFILHESSAGYGLLECDGFEEIGALLQENKTVSDFGRFGKVVRFKSFQPFESAEEALENINAISEHSATETLISFLEMNLPKSNEKQKKKPPKIQLGVVDPALATAISEGIQSKSFSCRSDETVREIIRGIRLHLPSLIKGLEKGALEHAQLGLGHSYSRSKVKFNPARSDNMIIQSIALLDQMDKDLNTFAMRVREWYSWHFPELKELVKDMHMYSRCAAFIQNKSSLFSAEDAENSPKLEGLIEIVDDENLAQSIIAAAKSSMGMDCNTVDMLNIVNFSQRMVKLADYRKQLATYLTDKMSSVAPNLSAILGDVVAARLISKAGSLTNLAKAPASTVQILGAEKALFRALKTKGKTPKYGLIYNSTFIGRAAAKNKGRISRYLANKCSIATRIDSFADEPTNAYGVKLREQVEERLKFYQSGGTVQPRKNIDVMEEVSKELKKGIDAEQEDVQMKDSPEKSKRKRDMDDNDEGDEKAKKKADKKAAKKAKKAKKESKESGDSSAMDVEETTPQKSKLESSEKEVEEETPKKSKSDESKGDKSSSKKKKKRKSKSSD